VALAAALGPLPFWIFQEIQDVAIVLSLVGGVVAIVFGSIGIARTKGADGALGRGLAIGGLVVGIVVVGTAVLVIIIAVLVVAAIIAACAGCGASSSVAVGMAVPVRQSDWRRILLAHHPACGHYGQDVWRPFGVAVCVGCFTSLPVFVLVLAFLQWWTAPAAWAWALGGAGLLLGSMQLASAAGWVRTRRAKLAVKVAVGVGLGLTVHALMAVPIPLVLRAAGGALLAAAILASGAMRARRMAGHDRRAHGDVASLATRAALRAGRRVP
jgi:hypothetical protein